MTTMTASTYDALKTAAERIGANNYAAQMAVHIKAGRSRSTFRFTVTPEHAEVVAMMGNRAATDDEAMGILWQYDTMQQRIAAAS